MKPLHLTVSILALGLSACSLGESPETGSRSVAAEQPGPAGGEAVALQDVCELLTPDELGAITGLADLVATPDRYEHEWSSCEYRDPVGSVVPGSPPEEQTPLLLLRIYWSGGRELWEMELGARQHAAELLAEPDVSREEIGEIVEAGPVAGLGDAAHFNQLLGSYVLVGDTLIQFIMPLMMDPEERFRPIADAVLSRL